MNDLLLITSSSTLIIGTRIKESKDMEQIEKDR
jgi:hypothetical protein